MSKDDRQNRIDDYLLNRADEAARREMKEEITRNQELSEQLADTELAVAAIELAEDQALKARLQSLEAGIKASTPATTAVTTAVAKDLPKTGAKTVQMKPRRNLRRLYGIAAAILMLLVAGWFILRPGGTGFDSPMALAEATFEPYQNITQGGVRGGDEDVAKAAYAAYDAGRFPEAITVLQALPQTAINKFYLGQSLLGDQQYAAAAAQFEDLRKMDFGLNQEAVYYLALARLGEGQKDQAAGLLNEITTEAGHPMRKQAEALLLKLNDLQE